jgi:hypothetical protein
MTANPAPAEGSDDGAGVVALDGVPHGVAADSSVALTTLVLVSGVVGGVAGVPVSVGEELAAGLLEVDGEADGAALGVHVGVGDAELWPEPDPDPRVLRVEDGDAAGGRAGPAGFGACELELGDTAVETPIAT